MLPRDRLRIFASSSEEELNEQLLRENQGLFSSSVPAIQFLQEKSIALQGMMRETAASGAQANERTASVAAVTAPVQGESSSPSNQRREDLECGAGGDHDLPYRFTLPTSLPQVLAWVKLQVKVQNAEFRP